MTTSGRKHLFTNADGLPDMVFTLCEPEVDSDGNLWLGNNSGLVKLDRRMIPAQSRGVGAQTDDHRRAC